MILMAKESVSDKYKNSRSSKSKLKNRLLAITVFSIIVAGVLFNNYMGAGRVISIAKASRITVESYSAPASILLGQNVVVDIHLTRPANSFDYGFVDCRVTDWRDKNLDVNQVMHYYSSRCIKLPESSSFTLQYSFKPLVMGYFKVESCTITSSPYSECSGAKLTDMKRDYKGVYVYSK